MKPIKTVLEQRSPQSIVNSQSDSHELEPIVNRTIVNRGVDRALEKAADLIEEPYKPWFAKQAYRIGADRFLGIADNARAGNEPKRLFTYLLKQA